GSGRPPAQQDFGREAMRLRLMLESGRGSLYRIGDTRGTSRTFDAQYWSDRYPLDKPLGPYQYRFGTPTMNPNFMIQGQLRPNAPFITRPAPAIDGNLGGAIEIVVNPGGVVGTYIFYFGR